MVIKFQPDKSMYKKKIFLLLGILASYALLAVVLLGLVSTGVLEKSSPTVLREQGTDSAFDVPSNYALSNLQAAINFLEENLVREDGHINVYVTAANNSSYNDNDTNSEAASYYLLWTAQQGYKESFDKQLRFVQENMLEPTTGYLMWRLTENDTVVSDGGNVATDADLRVIKALLIAERKWPSPEYTRMIDRLTIGLEKVGITRDGYLAPYGGGSGDSTWTGDEVWLSYSDFTVFEDLAQRKGAPWTAVNNNMKRATLEAQLENGLYNSVLTEKREHGNHIDGAGYSINSMWIMVRSAESGDAALMRSANKSLNFYKEKFITDGELYASYSSNGAALSPSDTPWVYALVGRAAIHLGDEEFALEMLNKLIEKQITEPSSPLYGSFPENYGAQARVGQFTMQESILTLQAYERRHDVVRN